MFLVCYHNINGNIILTFCPQPMGWFVKTTMVKLGAHKEKGRLDNSKIIKKQVLMISVVTICPWTF